MEGDRSLKICLIGAGNVASHLAPALARVASLVQIVSRSGDSARFLAGEIPGCEGIAGFENLTPDADFYLIAAADDSIGPIVERTPPFPGIWAHTSGSVSIDVFSGYKERYGSFYPLQTFSRGVEVDLTQVPFFIEGNTPEVSSALSALAQNISDVVTDANSELRRQLHIAAVFACNFANQMWAEADMLLNKCGLNISYLTPLITATVNKLAQKSPAEAMTGPARRGDINVINSHLAQLSAEQAEIYNLLSRRILNTYHPELNI